MFLWAFPMSVSQVPNPFIIFIEDSLHGVAPTQACSSLARLFSRPLRMILPLSSPLSGIHTDICICVSHYVSVPFWKRKSNRE